jgi:GT2 family glycosyltransferase
VATLVAEVEIEAPLPSLDPGRATRLLALLRRRGRPVGLLRMSAVSVVGPERLRREIDAHLPREAGPEAAPPPPAPPVSIVVCTRDRAEALERCLRALAPLAASGHDVIVVDNAPSDGRARAVAAAFPCAYVVEERPGLDRARNRGLAVARRPVVAFTDDDCEPDPRWADALAAALAAPGAAAATGLVLPRELETDAQERFESYCAHRRTFEVRAFRDPQTPPSTAGVAGMGANMAFRREWLERLGGFDPRFDGGTPTLSGGDTEILARVLAAGGTIVYDPRALVWHRHPREIAAVRRVVFGYGVGVSAVLWKRWREDGDTRALPTALRWLAGPPVKAAWRRARGRPGASPDLVAFEVLGFLHGPARLRAARSREGRRA